MARLKSVRRPKPKGISRIEQPQKHTVGWYARVRLGGRVQSKFFSDRAHGGRAAALKAALRWRKAAEREKGISRIEQQEKHTIGWYARVKFGGRIHNKFFSDNVHGGRDAALKEALRWRNATEREVGKPRTERVVMAKSARNRSGAAGVYLRRNQYVVTWSPQPGVLEWQLVSIPKYGKRGALARALALRRRKERQIYGQVLGAANGGKDAAEGRRQGKP